MGICSSKGYVCHVRTRWQLWGNLQQIWPPSRMITSLKHYAQALTANARKESPSLMLEHISGCGHSHQNKGELAEPDSCHALIKQGLCAILYTRSRSSQTRSNMCDHWESTLPDLQHGRRCVTLPFLSCKPSTNTSILYALG